MPPAQPVVSDIRQSALRRRRPVLLLFVLVVLAIVYAGWLTFAMSRHDVTNPRAGRPFYVQQRNAYHVYWPIKTDATNEQIRVHRLQDTHHYNISWLQEKKERDAKPVDSMQPPSNIRLEDYRGPNACRQCHESNFKRWYEHAHRLMNALAGPDTVKGDFSGKATIEYQGGVGSFYTENGQYYMKLERPPITRVYRILRTVGSRFFQSYAGVLVEGPDSLDAPIRQIAHHLPFSYWLDRKRWVPEVHIYSEVPDGNRLDVFGEEGQEIAYDKNCSLCHTTRPVGDWLVSAKGLYRTAKYSPRSLDFDALDYLAETHPESLLGSTGEASRKVIDVFQEVSTKLATEYAATLGISCEACHNGARDHVAHSTAAQSESTPRFFPSSEYVMLPADSHEATTDEPFEATKENINWICARCHSGIRTYYAGGMSTWNSTEASDAFKGFCYDRHESMESMSCVTCHDPHQTIGKQWARTPAEDDQSCIDCHSSYESDEEISTHTHHASGSAGSRCMNCHMPKINEGLQNVVRTHMIFNPTNAPMIEANHPNACNICHLDKAIDWTLDYLSQWYGQSYDEQLIETNYRPREQSVGIGWLKSQHEPTRLVAIESLGRAEAYWALDELIDALNDPFLLNREFTQSNIERMLKIKLESHGYQHYMSQAERSKAIEDMRPVLLELAREQLREP